MATKKGDGVQRGRGVATRLREKWGAVVARAVQRVAATRAARERTRELIVRDRTEARGREVGEKGGGDLKQNQGLSGAGEKGGGKLK